MIKHKGFSLGDYAIWDPRSDALIFYMKKIEEGKTNFALPIFDRLVTHHEFTHRYFYKSPGIIDIIFQSNYLTSVFFTKKSLEQFYNTNEQNLEFIRFYIKRLHGYIDDVGGLLDLTHVFILLYEYKMLKTHKIEDAAKYLDIVIDEKSKKIYDQFSWFSKNVESWSKIILQVLQFALIPGYSFMVKTKFGSNNYPTEILLNTLETLRSIYDVNSKKAMTIMEKISHHPTTPPMWVTYYKEITSELSKYNSTLEKIKNFEINEKHYLSFLKDSIPYNLQGRDFSKMKFNEVMKQGPSLRIYEDLDGSYRITRRRYIRNVKFVPLLFNLAMTHLQECVAEGAKLECYLCQLGHCGGQDDMAWERLIHDKIRIANKVLYN